MWEASGNHHWILKECTGEASGNHHWILKECTDFQVEENTEEGQDVEGGSAELNSYYALTAVAIKAKPFPFL